MYNVLSRVTDGLFEGVAIGGDSFPGSTLSDHCLRYQRIPQARRRVAGGAERAGGWRGGMGVGEERARRALLVLGFGVVALSSVVPPSLRTPENPLKPQYNPQCNPKTPQTHSLESHPPRRRSS